MTLHLDIKRLLLTILAGVSTAFLIGVFGSYIGSVRAQQQVIDKCNHNDERIKEITEIMKTKVNANEFQYTVREISNDIYEIKKQNEAILQHLLTK